MWSLTVKLLFAAFVLTSTTIFDLARAQSQNVTVTVTGTGPSIDAAKSDAVRQALQQTMKQLVVVDRAISGDSILRDKVMSTMNGYIERFQEKSVKNSSSGYMVEAEITVSASRIENFIGVIAGGGGAFSGPLILDQQAKSFAQMQADRLQAAARAEIFDRLLLGYPSELYDIKLIKVNVSPSDPNLLVLDLKISYKPTFIKALEGTLRALAMQECELVPWTNSGILYPPGGGPLLIQKTQMEACPARDRAALSINAHPYDTVCLGLSQGLRCFALLKADYCQSCSIVGKVILIFGRFVDSSGQSALVSAKCLMSVPQYAQVDPTFMIYRGEHRLLAAFGLHERYFQIQIPASLVNLQKATHFVAVAGMVPADYNSRQDKGQVIGLAGGPSTSGCNLVDEAVQHYSLSR